MNNKLKYKLVAIDFDDTIVASDYPHILAEKPHAKRVMKRIVEAGGQIAIWTARADLHPVKAFLKINGFPYHYINESFKEVLDEHPEDARKIFADVYIDDRNLETREAGGIDWLKIEKMLFEEERFWSEFNK